MTQSRFLSSRRFRRALKHLCALAVWGWVMGAGVGHAVGQSPEAAAEPAMTDPSPDAETLEQAAAASRPPVSFTAYYENDGAFLRPIDNTDRHYTSGQAIAWAWHENGGDAIADGLGLTSDGTALGFVLAQQIYTPEDIAAVVPDPDDRPYTGYLYLGTFWQREHQDVLDHVELQVGVTGRSSLAEKSQEIIHDLIDDVDPTWNNQLDSEFAINLTYRRKWRQDLGQTDFFGTPTDWQLIPRFELDVGTVRRRVSVGTDLRVGVNLPDDFGAARFVDLGSATGSPVKGLSNYVFVRAVGRYVEWDTFIEGSNYRDPSAGVPLEPFVGEVGAGFAVEWRRNNWVFNATYLQTFFSKTFEGQDEIDGLGSISLRAIYEF